jgi:hypothetical protein
VVDAPGANTVPVCRFFTTPGTFGAKSSHFYTAEPGRVRRLKLNPNWIYEKIAFHIAVLRTARCAAGTVPVYRAYNDGQTGAPNHRFTTDLALYQQFTTTQGWLPEGVAFCAPPDAVGDRRSAGSDGRHCPSRGRVARLPSMTMSRGFYFAYAYGYRRGPHAP